MSSLEAFCQPDCLTVFVDITDPYSYLAVPGTLRLLEQTRRSARWYPFIRSTLKPPPAKVAHEPRGVAHRRLRGEYRERELRFYAAALELPLQRLYAQADALPFANALLWLGAAESGLLRAPVFVQSCFSRYWSAALQISDCLALEQLLSASGADGALWLRTATVEGHLTEDARKQTEAHIAAARAAGLFNTPAYLYNDEVFYGRAHLPLLRERLDSGAE